MGQKLKSAGHQSREGGQHLGGPTAARSRPNASRSRTPHPAGPPGVLYEDLQIEPVRHRLPPPPQGGDARYTGSLPLCLAFRDDCSSWFPDMGTSNARRTGEQELVNSQPGPSR